MARIVDTRGIRRPGRHLSGYDGYRRGGRQGAGARSFLCRRVARGADRNRGRLRGAKKGAAAEDGQGRIYRDGRDRRGRGTFRRGRNRIEGCQEGRRLHALRGEVLRARRARRRLYRGRRAQQRQRRGRGDAVDGAGEAKRRDHHAAQDRRHDATALPRQVRRRLGGGREFTRQGRPGMADPAPHAGYRYRRALGRDGRDRAKGARYRGRLRQDAGAIRQADRIVPGGQAQVRRHDGGGREYALPHLLRLLDGRRAPGRSRNRGADGQGVRLRHGQERDQRSDSSAWRDRFYLGARYASVPSPRAGRRSELRQRTDPSRDRGEIAARLTRGSPPKSIGQTRARAAVKRRPRLAHFSLFTLPRCVVPAERLLAEHLVGVHRIQILSHRLDFAASDLAQKMIAVLIGLAALHFGEGLGLDGHPIALRRHSLDLEREGAVNRGAELTEELDELRLAPGSREREVALYPPGCRIT